MMLLEQILFFETSPTNMEGSYFLKMVTSFVSLSISYLQVQSAQGAVFFCHQPDILWDTFSFFVTHFYKKRHSFHGKDWKSTWFGTFSCLSFLTPSQVLILQRPIWLNIWMFTKTQAVRTTFLLSVNMFFYLHVTNCVDSTYTSYIQDEWTVKTGGNSWYKKFSLISESLPLRGTWKGGNSDEMFLSPLQDESTFKENNLLLRCL